MFKHFICRHAALLTFACSLAISTVSSGQTVTNLSAGKIEDLLSSGSTGILRNYLLVSGKVDKNKVAESITVSGNGRTISCDIVSQLVSYKKESVELICIRFTQGAKTSDFSLVQHADGRLSELQGNDLVAYSTTKVTTACIGGDTANCTPCSSGANTAVAKNASVALKVSSFLRATNSNCLGCFGDINDVIECITGHQ